MFEIECILDEGSWELASCQISTIICLLGLKQIRLGVPKVPGPLHTGSVEFSERVTSLMEIHFNQKKIHGPSGLVHSFFDLFSGHVREHIFHLKLRNVHTLRHFWPGINLVQARKNNQVIN